jgi:hypothetical protein
MNKIAFSVTAGLLAMGVLGMGAYAHAFGGTGAYGRHRGTAITPCVVVMTPQQKANLQSLFSSQKGTLKTDRESVAAARKALTAAILSGSSDVSSQETALNSAQLQLVKDGDNMAKQVCGQLTPSQLQAASTLFTNLSNLHATTHSQAAEYFQQAKAAAVSAGQ